LDVKIIDQLKALLTKMFVFVIFLACFAISECSYEEAILQKLLKFENVVQKMNNEITTLKKQVETLKGKQHLTGMAILLNISILDNAITKGTR
jgi:cell division protein FtsL